MKPKSRGALRAAIETVAALRSPKGCPWDRKQTHRSPEKSKVEFGRVLGRG